MKIKNTTRYMIVDENGAILQDGFDSLEEAELQSKEWADAEENFVGINEPDDGLEREISSHVKLIS